MKYKLERELKEKQKSYENLNIKENQMVNFESENREIIIYIVSVQT